MAFFEHHLHGSRFEGGVVPLEVLGDLVAFREMVLEVAKWRFLSRNPGRQRVPRGFTDNFSFNLAGLREGSAVCDIELGAPHGTLSSEYGPYFEDFSEALESIIDAVNSDDPITRMPLDYYAYFDRVGRSLRDGELLEFRLPAKGVSAKLDQSRRRNLLALSRLSEFTNEVTLRGYVPEMDQDRMTFELQPAHGPKVSAPLPAFHFDTVLQAFVGYSGPDPVRVMVSGIGRFNRQGRLQSLENVTDVSLLEPLDVAFRLDEFRNLQDGWLDGEGIAPPQTGLDWLTRTFCQNYPISDELPYSYPTPEGGVQFEWSVGSWEFALEVDLIGKSGEWRRLNLTTRESSSTERDLSEPDAWLALSSEIRVSVEQIG